MSPPEENEGTASPLEPQKTAKRPYQRPAFRFERVFETRALICGKSEGATQGACHSAPKTS
jgi:hypothetical protein